MDKIEAKITLIQETINQYKACRTELENMLTNLNSGIDYLKLSWEGQAQKSFFEKCYPQFKDSLNKHIKLISFFENELNKYNGQLKNLIKELKRQIA